MVEADCKLARRRRFHILVDARPLAVGGNENLTVVIGADERPERPRVLATQQIVVRIIDLVRADKEDIRSGRTLRHGEFYDVVEETETPAELPLPISEHVPGSAKSRRDLVSEGKGNQFVFELDAVVLLAE